MNQDDTSQPERAQAPPEGGYGAPTPEQEMPGGPEHGAVDPAPTGHGSAGQGPEDSPPETEDPDAAPSAEAAPEAPSTEAPLDEGNAGPTRPKRESFSSESDDDASGAPL